MGRMANSAATFGGIGSGIAGISSGAGVVTEVANGVGSIRVFGYTAIQVSTILIFLLSLLIVYFFTIKKNDGTKKTTLLDMIKVFLLSLLVTFLVSVTFNAYKNQPERSFEIAGVKGELVGCYQSGNAMRCDFTLVNIKSSGSAKFVVQRTSSSAVIPSGSSLVPYQMTVGDKTYDHTHGMSVNLPHAGQAYVSFDFKLPSGEPIDKVQGLEFVMSINGITETNFLTDIWLSDGY
ncbi:hypothetical protein MOU97_004260 [Vibrio vulnificus]|uniref:hypothetical protein n=1 Tax=Vibrio vulnificus TaxID=672 RepID=UPI001E34C437|nr:hypothetical protein [Vibrio vulnificus]EIV1777573.1 hypothetical protein [Vibrio vulnificus]EIZ0992103.1 hypothetical protein [Vibrio vulnificus]ELX4148898.1 hypothetical protein [Vibrio vulnificus]MCD1409449.1 hypothetical protein [Vibrio vulnificus]MCD1418552.1 hypothetical protein [Vibrio vulnificus]